MEPANKKREPCPRDTANPLSVLFFWWTRDLVRQTRKAEWQVDDLYSPPGGELASHLGDRLHREWERQVEMAAKNKGQPSLHMAILRTFSWDIALLALQAVLLQCVLKLLQPLLLRQLLLYFEPGGDMSRAEAAMYSAGLLLVFLTSAVVNSHNSHRSCHLAARLRAACCSLVYRKAVRVSQAPLAENGSGRLVNLVSVDVARFDVLVTVMHWAWLSPITIAVGVFLMMRDGLSLAPLAGLLLLLLAFPLQVVFSRLMLTFRRAVALKTDERLSLMDDVICGIRVIKMYAWEKPFSAVVHAARRSEMGVLRKLMFARTFIMSLLFVSLRAAVFATVLVMYYLDRSIPANKVFYYVTLLNILANAVCLQMTLSSLSIVEGYFSIGRLQSFMTQEEFSGAQSQADEAQGQPREAVVLRELSARWKPAGPEDTLANINLRVFTGQLVVVVGRVGSGKSSLLQVLMGELPSSGKTLHVGGKLSYAGQDPWVFPASLRQNVLFTQPLDPGRYSAVLHACALGPDLRQLPWADHTLVGARGVSLSGGQKARLNLARAVYHEADIYLLDDPLSAVDTHVGHHIFHECICSFLGGKTRVLVTHQLQYLRHADHILIMNNVAVVSLFTAAGRRIFLEFSSFPRLCIPLLYTHLASPSLAVETLMLRVPNSRHSTVDCREGRIEQQGSYQQLCESGVDLGLMVGLDQRADSQLPDAEQSEQWPRRISLLSGKVGHVSEEASYEGSKEAMAEASSKGKVAGFVCMRFLRLGAGWCGVVVLASAFLLLQAAFSACDYWVAYWVSIEETRDRDSYQVSSLGNSSEEADPEMGGMLSSETCVHVYVALVASMLLLMFVRSVAFVVTSLRNVGAVHDSMFHSVMYTCVRFFDTNPPGRILNRFSKDLSSIDETLLKSLFDASQVLLCLLGNIVVISVINQISLAALSVIVLVSVLVRNYYLKTSNNMKRLDGISKSPVFSHLHSSLQGLACIRACGAQQAVCQQFDQHQDAHTSANYCYGSVNSAFSFLLDVLYVSYMACILAIFLLQDGTSGSEAGLIISQLISTSLYLQWGIKQSAELSNNMTSVERALEYTQLPPEPNSFSGVELPDEWPSDGKIEFEHVFVKYADASPYVLVDLNVTINPKEKVGIVGRTGAGKSSLIASLLRTAKIEGCIRIDGLDTKDVSLQDLRSRLSIIPQDPVLFSGKLRSNLDPFAHFSDDKLWAVLHQVGLKEVSEEGMGLEMQVREGGSNLSVGQRQLVCLARAILRSSTVLLLDEATANVDTRTDEIIQRTIRDQFAECTVLTVAHRLNTIMDCDRVMVIDAGRLVEWGQPHVLLQDEEGLFYQMVQRTGRTMAEQLTRAAAQKHVSSGAQSTRL